MVTGDDRTDLPRSAFYPDLNKRLISALRSNKDGIKEAEAAQTDRVAQYDLALSLV